MVAKFLGALTFSLKKKYRERVFSNLSSAFGKEYNKREMTNLAKEIFFNFMLTPLETVYMHNVPFERFLLKIKIAGREHLDSALSKGHGVIALGSHLGSFTLLGTRLALEGYRVNIIINEGNFPKALKYIQKFIKRTGQNAFSPKPATTSIKKSLNCLRRNEILYLIADEQQRHGGIPVPFFGRPAYTTPGPAIFSLKTGAPLLPMYIARNEGTPHTLFIGSPIEIDRTGDEKKDTELLTARFTKSIEEIIKQYPKQWPWLNRRWKSPYPKVSLT